MIPVEFDYLRVDSVDGAIAALVEHGDDAKLIAGGHSLVPLMKLRLATPAVLVDIGRLGELAHITERDDHIGIGALTRHRTIERSELLAAHLPLLSHAAGHVGDPQVRNRGTIGGSLAHGDGASDLPAVLLALGGTLVARGPQGERTIAATDFFRGFLETALEPDEVLAEVRIPKVPLAGWSFQKLNRRAQDWAIVGCAVARTSERTGVGLVNMATTPIRAAATEAALADGAAIDEAAALADVDTSPSSDLSGSEEYRRHLSRVLRASGPRRSRRPDRPAERARKGAPRRAPAGGATCRTRNAFEAPNGEASTVWGMDAARVAEVARNSRNPRVSCRPDGRRPAPGRADRAGVTAGCGPCRRRRSSSSTVAGWMATMMPESSPSGPWQLSQRSHLQLAAKGTAGGEVRGDLAAPQRREQGDRQGRTAEQRRQQDDQDRGVDAQLAQREHDRCGHDRHAKQTFEPALSDARCSERRLPDGGCDSDRDRVAGDRGRASRPAGPGGCEGSGRGSCRASRGWRMPRP